MPSVVEQPGRAADPEVEVDRYLDAFEAAGDRRRVFLLREPIALLLAVRRVGALERLVVAPSRTAEGQLLRAVVAAMRSRVHTPLHAVSAVLTIPEAAGEYEAGSSKQTLRRKSREAERRGIGWAIVEEHEERRALMELADLHERTHEDARYRDGASDHAELVERGLWLVARARDGRPLLLSVTPVDRGTAALRYFRTLRSDDDASVARYLMTRVLVEELRRRGVRHLLDTTPSMRLPHGLRHFQRMVGFRLKRVELQPAAAPDRRARPVLGPSRQLDPGLTLDRGVLFHVVLIRNAVVTGVAAFGSEVLPAVLAS
jgi:hypothetical protein